MTDRKRRPFTRSPRGTRTPVRAVRLDDDRWNRVTMAADASGSSASDVIRAALDLYLPHLPA